LADATIRNQQKIIIMKKIFFLFALLASITASAAVTVTPLGVNYGTKTVTFRVSWGTAANNRVWVWVDLCPITGTTAGTFAKAVISGAAATAGSIDAATLNGRGFYVTTNPSTVTATLSNATGHFNWCAYGSDYPPNATMNNGTYALKGSLPFVVNNTTLGAGVNSFSGACITALTDATGCPGIINNNFTAGSITSATYNSCNNVAGTATTVATAPTGSNNYSYQWTVSYNNGTAATVSGATAAVYTPPATATAGTYRYIRQVKDNLCSTAYTNSTGTVTRVVYNNFTAGSITSATYNSCNNVAGTATTVATAPTGSNNYSYQWTVSYNNGTAATVSGATAAVYTPPATATAGTYRYIRQVKDNLCSTAYTNSTGTVTRIVYASLTAGAINSSSTIVRTNTAPATITSNTAASSGGGFTYRWIRSGSSSAKYADNNAGHSFTTAEINTVGTWTYYREVRDNTCATTTWQQSSGSYKLTVITCPYTGSDLYLDATHLCQQRTSGNRNWEAYIKDSRDSQIYRITQFSDNTWWFAENLAIADKSVATCSGVRLYLGTNKPACPSGWTIPTWSQYETRWSPICSNPPVTDSYGGTLAYHTRCYTNSLCGGTNTSPISMDVLTATGTNTVIIRSGTCQWNFCGGQTAANDVNGNNRQPGFVRCMR
jgi:hypothetical protein